MTKDTPLRPGLPIEALYADHRFVVWRLETVKQKPTKVPYTPGLGAKASTTNAHTWRSYGEARTTLKKGAVDGIGYVLTQREGLAAFDLDHCRDPESGALAAWAAELVGTAASYVEVTPSRKGLRIIGVVSGDAAEAHFRLKRGENGEAVEVYHKAARYITLSADRLDGSHDLADVTRVLETLRAEHDGASGKSRQDEDISLSGLNETTVRLIRNGAPVGKRSEAFMAVIAAMRAAGYARWRIEAALRAHPDGIAAKYLHGKDRLSTEIRRCLEKIDDAAASARQTKAKATRSRSDQPRTLEKVHATFRKWLSNGYDIGTLNAVLAAAATHKLGGDPLWLMVVGGPGAAKTETVSALGGAGGILTSTIASEGALLSATSKRSQVKGATGGLLCKLQDGILVIKDFTSILSLDRNVRGQVLAALREIYDGRWERNVGVDGGRTLTWEGRITLVAAVTTAWDEAHGAVAAMGDRFVIVRTNSDEAETGRQAIRNIGKEVSMRSELADTVAGLLTGIDPALSYELSQRETDDILTVANLTTLARTGVILDFHGDVLNAHAREAPTRFAKQLVQVSRGGQAIGLPRDDAQKLAMRCAHDSAPPIRLSILLDILRHAPSGATISEIADRINKPRVTVKRQLEALQVLGLLRSWEKGARYYAPGSHWDTHGLELLGSC